MIESVFGWVIAETQVSDLAMNYREEVAGNSSSGWWLWCFSMPVAATVIACLTQYVIHRPAAVVNTPGELFYELCKAHRLRGGDRRLLESIVSKADLEHPATVFLGVKQFDQSVAAAGNHIAYDRHQKSRLKKLRQRLFSS